MIEPISKPAPIKPSQSSGPQRVGEIRKDCVAIFVYENILDEILEFSEEDLQREIGGFLIGNLYIDPTQNFRFVEVEQFLPALDVRSSSASLTFTHDTWSQVNNEVQSRYPDKRIIGWHHTHPGLGVFLSAYDRFIHRNFFGADWQIAMVVDPNQTEFAFFQWHKDEVSTCGFVIVGDD